jgi:hypothetical protein
LQYPWRRGLSARRRPGHSGSGVMPPRPAAQSTAAHRDPAVRVRAREVADPPIRAAVLHPHPHRRVRRAQMRRAGATHLPRSRPRPVRQAVFTRARRFGPIAAAIGKPRRAERRGAGAGGAGAVRPGSGTVRGRCLAVRTPAVHRAVRRGQRARRAATPIHRHTVRSRPTAGRATDGQ